MTTAQAKVELPKIRKFKKLKNLQDSIVNLQAAPEGCSDLLKESLETCRMIAERENVFGATNTWEVKP